MHYISSPIWRFHCAYAVAAFLLNLVLYKATLAIVPLLAGHFPFNWDMLGLVIGIGVLQTIPFMIYYRTFSALGIARSLLFLGIAVVLFAFWDCTIYVPVIPWMMLRTLAKHDLISIGFAGIADDYIHSPLRLAEAILLGLVAAVFLTTRLRDKANTRVKESR